MNEILNVSCIKLCLPKLFDKDLLPKIVDVIYTDFSKAFDKVDHDLLLLKIEAYGYLALSWNG